MDHVRRRIGNGSQPGTTGTPSRPVVGDHMLYPRPVRQALDPLDPHSWYTFGVLEWR